MTRPGRCLPPGKTRYPLYRRLGGPQGRSGQVRKISPPPVSDPRTVQPVASRYTDFATRALYLNSLVKSRRTFLLRCFVYVRQKWTCAPWHCSLKGASSTNGWMIIGRGEPNCANINLPQCAILRASETLLTVALHQTPTNHLHCKWISSETSEGLQLSEIVGPIANKWNRIVLRRWTARNQIRARADLLRLPTKQVSWLWQKPNNRHKQNTGWSMSNELITTPVWRTNPIQVIYDIPRKKGYDELRPQLTIELCLLAEAQLHCLLTFGRTAHFCSCRGSNYDWHATPSGLSLSH